MALIKVADVLALASAGWPVFPVSVSLDLEKPGSFRKIPRIKAWGENASIDETQVRQWWGGQFSACMVGIPTGRRSGLFVIDIDIKGRRRGDLSLEALEGRLGRLPRTLTVRTASGGVHYYFAWDEVLAPASIRASVNKEWDGIDWRGQGGYVVGPGSTTPTGRRWEIIDRLPVAPLPTEWIAEILRASSRDAAPSAPEKPAAKATGDKRKIGFGFDEADEAAPTGTEMIPDGKRSDALTSAAGRLRRQGATYDEIDAALQKINQTQCDPPLPRNEVSSIARSVSKYAPGPPPMNDLGNATRFAERYRDELLYVPERDQWLVWDGRRWYPEQDAALARYVDEFLAELRVQAAAIPNVEERALAQKWAHVSGESKRVTPMIRFARAHRFMEARAASFDADRSTMAFQQFTIACKDDGEVQQFKHSPEDRITKLGAASGDLNAPRCKLWEAFVERSQPNQEIRSYLQRAAGYTLVGGQSEKCAFIVHGPPNTGKTVFVEALGKVFGDWRSVGEVSMFTGEGNKPVLAEAEGARIVTCGEIPHDRSFEAAVFKAWVGNDFITAAKKYKAPQMFKAAGKLWFAGNNPPHLDTEDAASWSRLRVIPFLVQIPEDERDGKLIDKFNLDGILAWLVEGWSLYREQGLAAPASISEATESARDESDRMKDALESLLVPAPSDAISWGSFRAVYVQWCKDMGVRPLSTNAMKQIMIQRHEIDLHRTKQGYLWRGVRLSPMGKAYAGANTAPVVEDEDGKTIL